MVSTCWLHQIHLPWLGKAGDQKPVPWTGVTGNPVINESSERRLKLENVLRRAAEGQSLSDKDPANSRYGSYGQTHKSPEGLRLILTKSGIAWQAESGEVEIIPLLLADIMSAPVQQKFSFTKPEATHIILVSPRTQSFSTVWLLCTNAGTSDYSVDHLLINLSRRGAIRWDIKDCCHFLAKSCGQGAHGSVFSGVSLLPLYDERRRLLKEKGDVVGMQKVHNFGRVAVKIWNKPPLSMIRQELYVLQAAAGHPNLSALLGLYCEGPRRRTAVIWLLVLEHCTGGDLFDYVKENYVSQNKCMEILMCVFSGLAHLHSLNIVHRDVKAENVVLQKHHAVLIDFGISADVNDAEEMIRPVGSPGYAAPEVIAVKPQRYNEKVDVFASGILVYFMLYRALPFWSDDHEEMLNKTRACEVQYPDDEDRPVRPELMAIMQHLLQKEAEDRPSALAAFLKFKQAAPEEILTGKGGRAFRVALAGLVKLGHLPSEGGQSFEEFSEESAEISEASGPAITVSSRPSTSTRSMLGSLRDTAVRRIGSIRLPRVRPTISKVLAGLPSPSRLALPTTSTKRLMPPDDSDGHGHGQAHDCNGQSIRDAITALDDPMEEMDQKDREKGREAASSSTDRSTALASESCETGRNNSKSSRRPNGQGSSTLDSYEKPQELRTASKHAPILEEEEQLLHSIVENKVEKAPLPVEASSDDLLGNVDVEADLRCSPQGKAPSDDVLGNVDMEADLRRSCHLERKEPASEVDDLQPELPEAVEVPRVMVVEVVAAPSSAPPPLTPVAPSTPAPTAVPKHRQRGLGVFRKLLSSS